MCCEAVMWEGEVSKVFPCPSSLHPSQDPSGPPASPSLFTLNCSPVHAGAMYILKTKSQTASSVSLLYSLSRLTLQPPPLPPFWISQIALLIAPCGFLTFGLGPLGMTSRDILPKPAIIQDAVCLLVFSTAFEDRQETSDNPNIRRDHLSIREQCSRCRRSGLATDKFPLSFPCLTGQNPAL